MRERGNGREQGGGGGEGCETQREKERRKGKRRVGEFVRELKRVSGKKNQDRWKI